MKKITAILLCLCAAVGMTACTNDGNTTTPDPMPTAAVDTIPSPDVIPEATAGLNDAATTPEGDAGIGGALTEGGTASVGGIGADATAGVIEGFEEGKTVEQTQVPDIVQAVKAQYPNAQITGVSMATHENKQLYHVMLSGDADTKEIYVDAQGNISPYIAGTADTANTASTAQ